MASIFDRLRNSPDAEAIKARADAAAAKHAEETGQPLEEEQGAEEGDMSDYVMPFKGLGKSILKAVAEKSAQAATKAVGTAAVKQGANEVRKEAVKDVKQALEKPAVAGPDYKNENIAFRPTQPGKQEGWERFNFKKAKTPTQ